MNIIYQQYSHSLLASGLRSKNSLGITVRTSTHYIYRKFPQKSLLLSLSTHTHKDFHKHHKHKLCKDYMKI